MDEDHRTLFGRCQVLLKPLQLIIGNKPGIAGSMVRRPVVSIEHDEMHPAPVKGIKPGRHIPVLHRPFPGRGSLPVVIGIMVPQDVIPRPVEGVPDLHEAQIALLRHTKVPELNDEIHLLGLHPVDEHPQAIVRIVHDVLVNIRNDPKLQRPR